MTGMSIINVIIIIVIITSDFSKAGKFVHS